jgi:hypothetical protein
VHAHGCDVQSLGECVTVKSVKGKEIPPAYLVSSLNLGIFIIVKISRLEFLRGEYNVSGHNLKQFEDFYLYIYIKGYLRVKYGLQ